MLLRVLFASVLFLCSPCIAQQGLTLQGKLVTDAGKPVPNTRVAVAGGPGEVTAPNGRFQIRLPNSFSEGERIILSVAKSGWVINSPLDGEWNLPNLKLQSVQTLDVIIVPKGSKALWTHARIEKLVARLADEVARLKKESETPKPVDFSQYLNDWAKQFGFTPTEVKAQFDEWAKSVDKSDDYKRLGLAAFYRKNFAEAATNFDKAAGPAVEKAKRSEAEFYRDQTEAFETLKLAGNSYAELFQFREALERYTRAADYVSKEKNPTGWAEIRISIGHMKTELGIRVEAEEGRRLLMESTEEYKQALTVFTREQFPQYWAEIQIYQGNLLLRQGERVAGEEGVRLLAQSVEAYRRALIIFTSKKSPQRWADVQNNLGNSLEAQGERQAGEEGARFLSEAVEAYKEALKVQTRERLPQQWATTQLNLCNALTNQAKRGVKEEGVLLLAQAVETCNQALTVYTRKQSPQRWADVQNNLGIALARLGQQMAGEEGVRLIGQAVEAYKEALTVQTRDQLPQQWASTQVNLGNALLIQGEKKTGEESLRLLREAEETVKEVLTVFTREKLPQQWVVVQYSLAKIYYYLKDWGNAARCYQNVLTLYPDNEEAYQRAGGITHEVIFSFGESFELRRRWMERHPDDLTAQSDFVENHFTTARFTEFEQRIVALLINPKIDVDIKVALRMTEIANLLALGKAEMVPGKLDELIENVSAQPADFKVIWSFKGTLHFIGQHEKLAPHREWLRQFFSAAQADNRDAIIKNLRDAKAAFKK